MKQTILVISTLVLAMYFMPQAKLIDVKNDNGIFTLRNGTQIDCRDGYSSDICCELWTELNTRSNLAGK